MTDSVRTGWRRRLVIGLVLGTAALIVALAASFLLRPFWWLERIGKSMLRSAGLERVELKGARGPLVYWRGGSGPTLVLLHGANDQAGAWARVAARLAQSRRLVVLDLPGHGESGPKDGPLSAGDLLRGVEQVVAAEAGHGRATLLGNSLGGYLAMLCAFRQPERVRQVILLNGAAIHSDPGVAINLLPRTRQEARAALEALTDPASPPAPGFLLDDLVRRGAGSPLARLLEAPEDPHLRLDERLGEMATPVTLVWGESDRLLPVAYAEEVRSRLTAARLEILPHCGHVPQRECPELAVAAIERALAEPPVAGAHALAGGPGATESSGSRDAVGGR